MKIEPPYGVIAQELKSGKLVPFLGAGASLSTRNRSLDRWDTNSDFLPSGGEVAAYLAKKVKYPDSEDQGDLIKVSTYYADVVGRNGLNLILHEIFARDYAVGEVHRLLATVDTHILIITTNYDDLVEKAFRAVSKPFHLLVYREDLAGSVLWWKPGAAEPEPYLPKVLPLSLDDASIIFKMHGTVDRQLNRWDSFVITEEDYVGYLAALAGGIGIPRYVQGCLAIGKLLFLGYGLRDWNWRYIMKSLEQITNPSQQRYSASWAVQKYPSEVEAQLWIRRGVSLHDIDINDFVANLRRELKI